MADQQLARRATIDEVVRVYERAAADIRAAFDLVANAEKALNEAFTLGSHLTINVQDYRRSLDFEDPERSLVTVRHAVWRALIERLEVRRMMSIRRWEELEKQINEHDLPEITRQSVADLVNGFASNLSTMLEEAVEEVFDWLRPHGSKYKRNSELEVPAKLVITYVVAPGWGPSKFRLNEHRSQKFVALENVVSALDGRGQIAKQYNSAIENTIREPSFSGLGETEYFRFRAFKNGNLHLEWKRLDLLSRFNAIAGGRRLRPAQAVA